MRQSYFVSVFSTGIVSAVLLAGCTEVVSGNAQMVNVDTGIFGEYAPGTDRKSVV